MPLRKALSFQIIAILCFLFASTTVIAEQLTHTIAHEKIPSKDIEQFPYDEHTREYPVFSGHKISALVNNDIQKVVELYSCDENGMSDISVKITYQSKNILSLNYHAHYMCDGMPRDSSSTGVFNYSLLDNKKITLADIIKEDALDDFVANATQKINKITDDPELNELIRCKVEGPLDFYLTDTGMTVFYEAKPFGFVACNGEISYDREALEKVLRPDFQ